MGEMREKAGMLALCVCMRVCIYVCVRVHVNESCGVCHPGYRCR